MTSMNAGSASVDSPVSSSSYVSDLIAALPPVMSPRTLSEATEFSTPTLTRWRKTWPNGKCIGPAFSTPPDTNAIRYSRSDVARWLADSHIETSKKPGAGTPGETDR